MIQRLRVTTLQNYTTKKQKLFQQISMKRKEPVKRKICIFYVFLLITIALIIVVSIYCYAKKY